MNDVKGNNFKGAYRHEWGHYLDRQIGIKKGEKYNISYHTEFRSALSEDGKELKSRAYYKALRKLPDEDDENNSMYVTDLVAAATRGRLGYGHTQEYFDIRGNREAEAFANIVSLVGSGDRTLVEVARRITPRSVDVVEKLLKENG